MQTRWVVSWENRVIREGVRQGVNRDNSLHKGVGVKQKREQKGQLEDGVDGAGSNANEWRPLEEDGTGDEDRGE